MFHVYLGIDPVTRKEKRVTRRGFEKRKNAQIALNKILNDYDEGMLLKDSNITFTELYDLWIEQYRLRVKPSSVAVAQRFCKKHIIPAFGNLKLNTITVAYCQKIVNQWHKKYKQYAFLRKTTAQIMRFGIAMELLNSNPMAKTLLPRKIEVEKPINFYSKEELHVFLDCTEKYDNQKIHTFFRLLAFTGMRKSEALSLQWRDIDFVNKNLQIGKTIAIDEFGKVILQVPKTISSFRKIQIDDKTLFELKKWHNIQQQQYLQIGMNVSSSEQFIFTNDRNELYYPQAVNDWLYYLLKKYQLKRITPHGFRHTHCSLLFESGASIKEVQARLGHKDIKTTMNIYAHVTEQTIEETGKRFAQYVNF